MIARLDAEMREVDEDGESTEQSAEDEPGGYDEDALHDVLSSCFGGGEVDDGTDPDGQLVEHLGGCIDPYAVVPQHLPFGLEEENDSLQSAVEEESSQYQDKEYHEGG